MKETQRWRKSEVAESQALSNPGGVEIKVPGAKRAHVIKGRRRCEGNAKTVRVLTQKRGRLLHGRGGGDERSLAGSTTTGHAE